MNYVSYNENLISNKINSTNKGVVVGNILLNGNIEDSQLEKFVLNNKINSLGRFIKTPIKSITNTNFTKFQLKYDVENFDKISDVKEQKKYIDNNKIILNEPNQILEILGLPDFELLTFDEKYTNDLSFVNVKPSNINSNDLKLIFKEISNFEIGSYGADKWGDNQKYNWDSQSLLNFPFELSYFQLKDHYTKSVDSVEVESFKTFNTVSPPEKTKLLLLKNFVNQTISNSILVKTKNLKQSNNNSGNLQIIHDPQIDHEKPSLTLFDKYSNKYIHQELTYKIEIANNGMGYEVKTGIKVLYFDGVIKYNYIYDIYMDKLIKYWTE